MAFLYNQSTLDGVNSVLPYLPEPALAGDRYGVGFLIIHQGTMRNWFLLDWWEHQSILLHHLFSSLLHFPYSIMPKEDNSVLVCVHEL